MGLFRPVAGQLLSFVLILHVPSLSLLGPNILLNIFLSNTNSFCFIVSFRTHVPQAYVITGLTNVQYIFGLDLFDSNFLLNKACFA
jgi:hypothetical protein